MNSIYKKGGAKANQYARKAYAVGYDPMVDIDVDYNDK
jgi:hypothetical protein